MTSEAETQLLPGATGYRPLQPHTFLGDDLEEEQGNSQDADDSMTEVEPGTPGGGIIDPTVPAIPAPGTPELGNPEDEAGPAPVSMDPEPPVPVPVPDCVPVFHMPDSDTVRESPPTPAPPHSVTGVEASGVARPIMSLSSFPQDTCPAPAEVPAPARHTQVLESGTRRGLDGNKSRGSGTPFVPNDGQPAGARGPHLVENLLTSSEGEKPEPKKPKLASPTAAVNFDELSDALSEGPPHRNPAALSHPYTPVRIGKPPETLHPEVTGWMLCR